MERSVLIRAIMWEYNISKANANALVTLYENHNKYNILCEFVKDRRDISMIRENYV